MSGCRNVIVEKRTSCSHQILIAFPGKYRKQIENVKEEVLVWARHASN